MFLCKIQFFKASVLNYPQSYPHYPQVVFDIIFYFFVIICRTEQVFVNTFLIFFELFFYKLFFNKICVFALVSTVLSLKLTKEDRPHFTSFFRQFFPSFLRAMRKNGFKLKDRPLKP